MADNSASSRDDSRVEVVLAALDDPDCRAILRKTAEPMTANELADACEIPHSTLYRKLEHLTDAALLEKSDKIHPDGGRKAFYQRNFESVNITIDEADSISVSVERSSQGTDERLRDIWSKMGDEL